MRYKDFKGYTLLEILIVVSIIGILSAIVMTSYIYSLNRGDIARVQIDLKNIALALARLQVDARQGPGHTTAFPCVQAVTVTLDGSGAAGLLVNDAPTPYPNWSGPYVKIVPRDPWGQNYVFDANYNCGLAPALGCENIAVAVRAIHSRGPNGSAAGVYDADNIVLPICR